MSHTPNYDAKVKAILDATQSNEQRTCPRSGETWTVTDRENEWSQKFNVPVSHLSPRTRWLSIGAFTIGYEFWWNQHAETGKPIFTFVHPATGVKVLPDAEWQEKDFRSEARDYDVSRPFFDQLKDLRQAVPMGAFFNQKKPENSIALISNGDVNSYFVIACQSKNSFYSSDLINGESSSEVFLGLNIVESHRVVHSSRIHRCQYVLESYDCRESAFLFDCRDCENCFGAWNQRHKKYLWWNEQLSKEEWEKRRSEVDLSSRAVVETNWQRLHQVIEQEVYWPEHVNEHVDNCTGEYLTRSVNCKDCFVTLDARDNECGYYVYNGEGNYYVGGSFGPTRCYLSGLMQESADCKFSAGLVRCRALEYSLFCQNSEYCFGCVGLNRQKFCIFNKQYTEEEYWKKVDEIKCQLLLDGVYGDFFPLGLSTSHPLSTVIGESMLGTQEEIERMGGLSFAPDSHGAIGDLEQAVNLTSSDEMPDCIADVDNDVWAGKPLIDKKTGRRFALLKQEIEHYKKFQIAPPIKHHLLRVKELYWMANAFVMVETSCVTCKKSLRVADNKTFKNRKHLCRPCYLAYLETR